jgi:hypothetical protein
MANGELEPTNCDLLLFQLSAIMTSETILYVISWAYQIMPWLKMRARTLPLMSNSVYDG